MDYIFKKNLTLSNISNGFNTLEELLSKGKGIYISELVLILNELIHENKIIEKERQYYLLDKTNLNKPLLEPHPLDYDWRFDHSTSIKIVFSLMQSNKKNNVLLLGSPTIFNELLNHSTYFNKVMLLDWNKELISDINNKLDKCQSMKAFHFDLLSNVIAFNEEISNFIEDDFFDYIIIDPPWYLEHYKSFILQSTVFSNIGSTLIISLLPLNSRPNAFIDRWKIFEIANNFGFHLEELKESYISYKTPFFEARSMQEIDIDIKGNWRTSDLLVLKKIEHKDINFEKLNVLLASITKDYDEKNIWIDFRFNNFKIKIRNNCTDFNLEPKILKIEKNNILKTVSRRYEKRKYIDIWFYDNRVYGLNGIIYFIYSLSLITGKKLPKEINIELLDKNYIKKSKIILEKLLRNKI